MVAVLVVVCRLAKLSLSRLKTNNGHRNEACGARFSKLPSRESPSQETVVVVGNGVSTLTAGVGVRPWRPRSSKNSSFLDPYFFVASQKRKQSRE